MIAANLMASRLTVLYGETGVGKSSVLHAGVARHLRSLAEPVAVVVFDSWQDEPLVRLEREIAEAGGVEPTGSLADTIEGCTARLDGELYVMLDQLEEYFLYREGEEGPGTLAVELPEAIRRRGLRVSFLLSLREDTLAKLDRFKGRIPNLLGNYLRLDHLDRTAAREAILGPLERYGQLVGPDESVEIEPGLVEAVLEEASPGRVGLGQMGRGIVEASNGNGRVETAYLQLVMQRLWDAEEDAGSRVLRLSTFRALGGAEQIVRDHLVLALEGLDPPQQDLVAEVFDHLVTPSGTKIAHGVRDLARYADVEEGELLPVLQALTEARIVRPTADETGKPRYEIYHDVLAEAVLAWRTQHEANRQLELERTAAQRRHRRLLGVIAGALIALVAMAGVAVFALTQRSDARSQARKAHARELDATALSELSTDPEESLVRAVQAARLQRTALTEDVLRRSLLAVRLRSVLRATGPVTAAFYSGDGRRILTASLDGHARLYDARGGRLLRVLAHGAPITSAAFSADGRLAVTGGRDGLARIWDVDGGRTLRTLHHGKAIRAVAIDPAGSVIATAGGMTAKLWRADSGALVARTAMTKPVTSVVFSPDGRLVAVSGNDTSVLLVDTDQGRVVRRLEHGARVTSVAFRRPGGKQLATTGVDGVARLWDERSGALVRKYVTRAGEVLDAAFSPGGRLLATANSDGTARIWDVRSGALTTPLAGHQNFVVGISFSPDGNFVVTASRDRTARVWKADDGQQVALLAGHGETVSQAAFSPSGRSVLTHSEDGTARTWDPATQPRLRLLLRANRPILGASFSGTQRVLVFGPGRRVRLVRASDGKVVRTFPAAGRLTTAAASLDGSLVAVATGRRVAVFAARDGSRVAVFRQPSLVSAVAFSPDGKRMATAGLDGIARLWAGEGRLLRELAGHEQALTDVAYSPDGHSIATASKDKTARIWDTRTGALLRTLTGHHDDVTSVAFSPDGRFVLTASSDHDARIWDAGSGGLLQKLRWHFGRVAGASFSSDGRWIVTAGPLTAQLWQPGIRDPLLPFGLGGHRRPLVSAVFGPRGWLVLTASQDGTVRTYRCTICGGIDELLPLAEHRLAAVR